MRSLFSLIRFARTHERITWWVLFAIAFLSLVGLIASLFGVDVFRRPEALAFGSILLGVAPFLYQLAGDRAKRQESARQAQRRELTDLAQQLREEIQSLDRKLDNRLDVMEPDLKSLTTRIQTLEKAYQTLAERVVANSTMLQYHTEYYAMQVELQKIQKALDQLKAKQVSDEQ